MSVRVEYGGRHGLYAARLFDCVRAVEVVQQAYGEVGAPGVYGIQGTLDMYAAEMLGIENFVLEDDTEEDCLVILAAHAPGGSEWPATDTPLVEVERWWKQLDQSARMSAQGHAEAERYEEERLRRMESYPCDGGGRGGW